jgi:hypothetical protein
LFCLGDASVKKHLPLRGELGNQISHLYTGLEVTKACGERGFSLSRHHFIAEATSPVRSENKEQEQKPNTLAHSEQKAFVVFLPKILLHIVCIFNILIQTEVTFQDSERSHFVIYVLYV